MAGEARYRFGSSVPLIGIAPWGIVKNRESLIVHENSINYGYKIRKPVEFQDNGRSDGDYIALDSHHSHFILVSGAIGFGLRCDRLVIIAVGGRWTTVASANSVSSAPCGRVSSPALAKKLRMRPGSAKLDCWAGRAEYQPQKTGRARNKRVRTPPRRAQVQSRSQAVRAQI